MTRTFRIFSFLIGAVAMTTGAWAQPRGQKPAEGTFYLFNVAKQQYLSAAADGTLTLAPSGSAVSLTAASYNGAPFYTLSVNGKALAADVWQSPVADGSATSQKWLFTPVAHTDAQGYVYAVGNMQRQANACAHLLYSYKQNAITTSYAMPSAQTAIPATQAGFGSWLLVSQDDYEQNLVTMDEKATTYTQPTYVDATHPATVLLKRKLTANAWNSFCLPFSLTARQLTDAFQKGEGTGSRCWLARFTSYDADGVLHFEEATDGVEAGVPYLFYPTKVDATTEYTFTGVTTFAAKAQTEAHGTCSYVPSFVKGTAPQGAYVLSKNEVYHLTKDTPTNGFRGYFQESSLQSISAWQLDQGPTGISAPTADGQQAVPFRVYSVDGRLLKTGTTTLDGLPRGVYMMKGKKVTK